MRKINQLQRFLPALVGQTLYAVEHDAHSQPDAVDSAQRDQPQSTPAEGNNFQGLHAGYILIASVLLGLGLGYGLDVWLNSFPWGMVGGSLFFIVAGLYQVVKEFTK